MTDSGRITATSAAELQTTEAVLARKLEAVSLCVWSRFKSCAAGWLAGWLVSCWLRGWQRDDGDHVNYVAVSATSVGRFPACSAHDAT